jgi:HEAT repeat protein
MGSSRLEGLIAQLGAKDGLTRQRARETLVAIGEPALVPLVGLLGSPDLQVRWEAAKALTETPDPAAIPGLIPLLADRHQEVGWLAAVALINLGNRSVPDVLKALTDRAESKSFREASHHVFHDLSERNGVLREILKPVVDALEDLSPDSGVIASRAERALQELRALSSG